MPGVTVHFLLVYSYDDQELIEQREFRDSDEAVRAYKDAEERYRGRSDSFEVVLVGSDSLDTVVRTHGHYFSQSSDAMFSELLSITHPST